MYLPNQTSLLKKCQLKGRLPKNYMFTKTQGSSAIDVKLQNFRFKGWSLKFVHFTYYHYVFVKQYSSAFSCKIKNYLTTL